MQLNDLNLSEIITLCKSQFSKLANSKENCIKLYQLLQQIKPEEEEVSEMEQPRKFRFVSERELKVDRGELVGNSDLLMTMINQCQTPSHLASNLFLYNNSDDESNDSTKSMKRSQATINLLKGENDTVLSTAEQHQISCIQVDRDFRKMKPKSTSSTTSLLAARQADVSVTFNVNVASTPKKVFHRTSVIRKAIRKHPLTSTLIRPEVKKMRIPPPLLSSSIVPDVKVMKRVRSSSGKERKSKMQKVEKLVKRECCAKYERRKVIKSDGCGLKYPIKFCPYLKSKDIDRINVECVDGMGFENNLKPCRSNSNCYGYGDYNVWFL